MVKIVTEKNRPEMKFVLIKNRPGDEQFSYREQDNFCQDNSSRKQFYSLIKEKW